MAGGVIVSNADPMVALVSLWTNEEMGYPLESSGLTAAIEARTPVQMSGVILLKKSRESL